MNYDQLRKFITEDMQMQHIYQPVMLIELLKNGGQATEEEIARVFLNRDPTQQKHYEDKVRNMVGKVLKSNGITDREKSVHRLIGYDQLTPEQVEELLELLPSRLSDEESKRGPSINMCIPTM